ncbi:hypothetical protein L226DRAFT_93548 [Lentinus tigrinus ALCF2SS1-7]|uniref:F-box domain-containing protein n=1 Tax=Lentinus tigrinus ALCF2SS1-6 TaxID=1328759 RepID=A0A5C2RYD5_9APHY|nr:hypothetical protein L227DRAFT_286068 [Lentinus tigrinus ALCF2SS1-6]RPD74045.1 hypothetical protein L226DRAFT_93548 [Lentinus tigrinus ALCF2SS1-7]
MSYSEGDFTVDDTDINNIAQAWPNLAVLDLGPSGTTFDIGPPPVIVTSPGVDSLCRLTSKCKQLRSLQLPHLRLPKSVLDKLDDYPQSNHGLNSLQIYRVDVADWSQGGRLLDRFFPRLDIGRPMFQGTPGWDFLEYATFKAQCSRRVAARERDNLNRAG